MAIKIFFLGFVVFLTIQGLNASSLSKRDIWSDMVSQIQNAENYTANAINQAEQDACATIQAAIANATNAVNNGIATANAAVAQINNQVQQIANAANAVVTNAQQELAALQASAVADITAFLNTLTQYGNGTVNCVYNYRDTIMSVIGSAGSNVTACTVAVVQTAAPIVADAVQIATSLVDLNAKVTGIVALCIPAGATVVLAVPCVLLQALFVGNAVITDITNITNDVNYIIANTPVLIQQIQSCSAVVQNATTNVNNLLGTLQSCVNTYVS